MTAAATNAPPSGVDTWLRGRITLTEHIVELAPAQIVFLQHARSQHRVDGPLVDLGSLAYAVHHKTPALRVEDHGFAGVDPIDDLLLRGARLWHGRFAPLLQ